MKLFRRFVSIILTVLIIYSMMESSLYIVFAAETPVTVTVDKYENGRLDFHWSRLPGAKAAVIAFHKPKSDDTSELVVSEPVLNVNSASISGLKADYIYDITVVIYGSVDSDNKPTGEPIGRGILFYLPSMTFYSSPLAQDAEPVTGGGFEIGGSPKLKLRWKIPKVYCDPEGIVYPNTEGTPTPGNNRYVASNSASALKYMQDSLRMIYQDDRELKTLNFIINISTELNSLNSTPNKASINIEQSGSDYNANVSGDTVNTAKVAAQDTLGFISIDLWGRADETGSVPSPTSENILPDKDLLPGTVYYMNIKPVFKSGSGTNVSAVTVGNPSDQNGSLLTGEASYAYTPIRFQITKDSANNVYVKIYKINQGSLDLPRLYYEIQATNDSSIAGDWTVKKTMDDSYFSGPSAVTIITGVNPNNKVYYKIVVKSDSPNDRLESLPLAYTLITDTSRPPLPIGIAIQDRLPSAKDGVVLPSGVSLGSVKSSDITISWDKPLNWESVKNSPLSYHFLLSTSQQDVSGDIPLYMNGQLIGSYPAKYRLVKHISTDATGANVIKEEGNRLSYTLNAFDLFTWQGKDTGGDIDNEAEKYPDILLPNTVYYLQMYTTKKDDEGTGDTSKMSDKSIILSFTTLSGMKQDVPLPMSFTLDANGEDASVSPSVNFVDLKFDKVSNIDWHSYTDNYDETKYTYNVVYDIFMNTRTDAPFTQIGTTEKLDGDIVFTGAEDLSSTSIKARVSTFADAATKTAFGSKLLPNTTYYFRARTRLVIKSKADGSLVSDPKLYSIDTAILPVTTVSLEVNPPDESQRKPLAPADFNIAVDNSGNQLLSGSSVTFTWKNQEDDVIYELIRTSQKMGPMDKKESYGSDPEYLSFLQEYDIPSDGKANGAVYLDPLPVNGHESHPGKFTYDSKTKTCTYTVDRRMFPNKLYYFSLRAVRVDQQREPLASENTKPSSYSAWVSIPVTTYLIESPSFLEVTLSPELGFYWKDSTKGLTADNYAIYIKKSGESSYKLVSKSQATIVKDRDGETYYGRVTGLKTNSQYDVKVTKGNNTTIFEKAGLETRDGYHEIDIKWLGKPVDSFSKYEVAIMAEGSSEYTVLKTTDMQQYKDKNGSLLPYYTEETARTINNETIYFHTRIKSAETILPGGITTNSQLKSNTKYYIKVRAVKIDPTEPDLISYSKFIGPVNSRTEFNQGDYDDTDRDEKKKAVFLDSMSELEKGLYWRVAMNNSGIFSILLKADRIADALAVSKADSFTVDIADISKDINTNEIYVPLSVLNAMNSYNRSLVLRLPGSELMLRPYTLDAEKNEQIKDILTRNGVKDIYVRMLITRSEKSTEELPAKYLRISLITDMDLMALGLSSSDPELRKLFQDKLYNKDSGLVNEKLNMLMNTYVGGGTGSSELIKQYTSNLISMIEKELSVYIDKSIASSTISYAVRSIESFDEPAAISLAVDAGNGVKLPHVLYDKGSAWQKISDYTATSSKVQFNILKTGKYVILSSQGALKDLPSGHWAESYIRSMASRYDLSDVFTGISSGFMPDNVATCKEVVLLYEKVTGRSVENAGLDIRQKNVKLGLSSFINSNSLGKNVKRQETAAVLMKLFSIKTNAGLSGLRPSKNVEIADESHISSGYYNYVLMVIDMGVMSQDENNKFNPNGQMTRAEVVAAFSKLLEITDKT